MGRKLNRDPRAARNTSSYYASSPSSFRGDSVVSMSQHRQACEDTDAGYAHRNYAMSFEEVGRLIELPRCRGWIIERPIPGTPDRDTMGCYPLFCCVRWAELARDLESIAADAPEERPVALTLVPDPFGGHTEELLQECFPDLCRPFKEHFVVDLSRDPREFVSSHHRRYSRKALKELTVERAERPADHLDEWVKLYDEIVARHQITGMAAFSRNAFARQLETPGALLFRALCGNEIVGAVLWYIQGDRAYYHLAGYTELGYRLRASFAIFWQALSFFSGILTWVDLGASAGLGNARTEDGLGRFKRGWSTETRTAYLCGRVFDPDRYLELVSAKNATESSYFPAYRGGR